MAAIPWPSSLPQEFHTAAGYTQQPRDNAIREQMEVGPPKLRRRATVQVVDVQASMYMTDDQHRVFTELYEGSLAHGTRAFAMVSPDGILREYFIEAVTYTLNDPWWRLDFSLMYIA